MQSTLCPKAWPEALLLRFMTSRLMSVNSIHFNHSFQSISTSFTLIFSKGVLYPREDLSCRCVWTTKLRTAYWTLWPSQFQVMIVFKVYHSSQKVFIGWQEKWRHIPRGNVKSWHSIKFTSALLFETFFFHPASILSWVESGIFFEVVHYDSPKSFIHPPTYILQSSVVQKLNFNHFSSVGNHFLPVWNSSSYWVCVFLFVS